MKTNPYQVSPASDRACERALPPGFNLIPCIAACFAILFYVSMVVAEAGYYAGGIGFNEQLTPSRMLESLGMVSFGDIISRDFYPADWISFAGMLVAPMLTLKRIRAISLVPIAGYALLWFAMGGWMGLIGLLFLPLMAFDLDGEFLADGPARLVAYGVWGTVVIGVLVYKIRHLCRQSASVND